MTSTGLNWQCASSRVEADYPTSVAASGCEYGGVARFSVRTAHRHVPCRDMDSSQVPCTSRVGARAMSAHRTVPGSVPGCRHRSCPRVVTDRTTVLSTIAAGSAHVTVTMRT